MTQEQRCSECDRCVERLTPVVVNHTIDGHPLVKGWCEDCRRAIGITDTAPTIAGLLEHRERIKARFDCSDRAWAELFAVETALRAFDACPYATYNED